MLSSHNIDVERAFRQCFPTPLFPLGQILSMGLWIRIRVFWSDPDPILFLNEVGSESGFQDMVESKLGFEDWVGSGF